MDDTLFIGKNYLKKVLDLSSDILCSDKSKQLFFRSRMFFRIRQLNRDLHDQNQSTVKTGRCQKQFNKKLFFKVLVWNQVFHEVYKIPA